METKPWKNVFICVKQVLNEFNQEYFRIYFYHAVYIF